MKNILIFFILCNHFYSNSQDVKRFELFVGTSLGIQQISMHENALYNTNPFKKNSPNWIVLYQIGCNYNYYTFHKIRLNFGLQLHEKGSANSYVDLLNPLNHDLTRAQSVIVYFLLSQQIEYQYDKSSFLVGITYGRDVFEFIPFNIRETALVLGFKRKIFKNFSLGLIFNQSLNKNITRGVFGSYNSNLDANIIFKF